MSRACSHYLSGIFAILLLMQSAEVLSADERQRYQLELFITWSEQTHPHDWSADAGLSQLIGIPHTREFALFRDGEPATQALRQLAETGGVSLFQRELEQARLAGRADAPFDAGPLDSVPGYLKTRFETSLAHPFVSFAAALKPSPDWFTGANGIALRANGEWRDSVEFIIFAWDAGTDDGPSYASENQSAANPQSVRLLATPHVITRHGLAPVGRAVLTRLF